MKMKTAAAMLLLAAAVCAGLLFPAFVLRAMDAQLEKGEILVDGEMTVLTKDRSSYYEALAVTAISSLSVRTDGADECCLNEESAGQRAAEILAEYAGHCPESCCPEGVLDSILNGSAAGTCLLCTFEPVWEGAVWACEWDFETDGESGGAAVLIDDETGLLLSMAVYGRMQPAEDTGILGDVFASCCRLSFVGAGETAVSGSVSGSLLHFDTEDGRDLELPLILYVLDEREMLLAFNMPGTNDQLFYESSQTDAFLTESR